MSETTPAPRRPSPRMVTWLTVAIGVIVVVVIGMLVIVPFAQTKRHVWTVDGGPSADSVFFRGYNVGQTLVRVGESTVTGFRVSDGETAWSVKPEGTVCAAAPRESGGVTAILFGTTACDQVAAVDIERGEILWTKELRAQGPPTEDDTQYAVTIAGDQVVASDSWELQAFAVTSGKPRWHHSPVTDNACRTDSVVADGDRLYATVRCVDAYDDGQPARTDGELLSLDPESGDRRWRQELDGDISGIASVDPPIVQTREPGRLRIFGQDGRPRSTIKIGAEVGDFGPETVRFDNARDGNPDFELLITGELIVGVGQGHHSVETPKNAKAVGYGIADGKVRWESELDSTGPRWVETESDDTMTLLDSGGYDIEPRLLTVDPHTGDVDDGPVVHPHEDDDFLPSVGIEYRFSGDTLVGIRSSRKLAPADNALMAYR